MNKLIIFILTLLPVFSYSQVTSINIDTSASQVIIINNGTMIENNGGTVNIGSESKNQDNHKSTGKSDGCSGSTTYTRTGFSERSDEGKCVYKYDLYSQREHSYTEREQYSDKCNKCNKENADAFAFAFAVLTVFAIFLGMIVKYEPNWKYILLFAITITMDIITFYFFIKFYLNNVRI